MGGSGVKRDENIVHNFTKTGAQLMNRSNEYERAVSNNGTSPVVMSAWTRSPEVQVVRAGPPIRLIITAI